MVQMQSYQWTSLLEMTTNSWRHLGRQRQEHLRIRAYKFHQHKALIENVYTEKNENLIMIINPKAVLFK